jgi:hypothetical protein
MMIAKQILKNIFLFFWQEQNSVKKLSQITFFPKNTAVLKFST